MRQIVVHELLDESDARPPHVFGDLVAACVDSAAYILTQKEEVGKLEACFACGETSLHEAFIRHGYTYLHCPRCWSLLAEPRPSVRQARWYLRDSPVAEYRRGAGYLHEIGPRLRDLAAHRAVWLSEFGGEADDPERLVVHVQPYGPFLAEELAGPGFARQVLVEPRLPALTEQHDGAASWRQCATLDELESDSARLMTAFDVLEGQADPLGLLGGARRVLSEGGHLMFTARSASGFDIQTLWHSADVFPLEHINLFSVEGMRTMLERIGFEVLEISTPGLLDLQVVRRVAAERSDVRLPRFIQYLLEHRDRQTAERFQEFLQQQRLSSHMRVLARKAA